MRAPIFWLMMALGLFSSPANAWWEEGHRTVARLAAYYLTPAAQLRMAAILDVPNTPEAVADALAVASTWADEIKNDRPETRPWHYIDLALQDRKAQIAERCMEENCVTARIMQFATQLKNDQPGENHSADLDALRFLVHFVGDVHQPLHASSDADLGGNCELLTEPYEKAKNLHALWDGPLVSDLNADDRALAGDMEKELDAVGRGRRKAIAGGTVDDWAWESHRVAEKLIYKRLKIPTEPVVFPSICKVAPERITEEKISVEAAYLGETRAIVRMQLERAGLRLAKLLNGIAIAT